MGLFDRAKRALGIGEGAEPPRQGKKGERPPLRDLPAVAPTGTLDDALVAREAGDLAGARATLAAIDRGKGLRTVLRAAAALEAGDEEELAPLLPAVAAGGWMLALQIAASVAEGSEDSSRLFARAAGAPAWALAWTRASSYDDTVRRKGMVDLLFADAALARTVAAREWKIEGAVDEREAVERYAGFAHGRDAIRRFGAEAVGKVFLRAKEP